MFFIPLSQSLISFSHQKEVYKRFSFGFILFEQLNEILPSDSILLSEKRAFTWTKNKTVPIESFLYTDPKDYKIYKEYIKSKNPTYILLREQNNDIEKNLYYPIFKECLGNIIFKETI